MSQGEVQDSQDMPPRNLLPTLLPPPGVAQLPSLVHTASSLQLGYRTLSRYTIIEQICTECSHSRSSHSTGHCGKVSKGDTVPALPGDGSICSTWHDESLSAPIVIWLPRGLSCTSPHWGSHLDSVSGHGEPNCVQGYVCPSLTSVK